MPSQWTFVALVAALPLLVALTILIGAALPNGAITITSGAAVVTFTLFFFLGGAYAFYGYPLQTTIASQLAWLVGIVLLLAAWTLAFADAVRGRRWGWAAALTVAAYLSFVALLSLPMVPGPCMFVPPYGFGPSGALCGQLNQPLRLLVLAGCFVGALTAHLYSLRDTLPRRSRQPEGLVVSPLHARPDADDAPAAEPQS